MGRGKQTPVLEPMRSAHSMPFVSQGDLILIKRSVSKLKPYQLATLLARQILVRIS
jgi:hypothetical protein